MELTLQQVRRFYFRPGWATSLRSSCGAWRRHTSSINASDVTLDAWSFHREQSSSDIKATPSNTKDYPIQASSQNQTPSSVSTCDILSICQDRNPNDEPVRILRSRLRQLQTTPQPFNLLTAFTFLSTTSLECRGIKLKGDVNMVLEF